MFKMRSVVAIAIVLITTAISVAAQDQNRPDSQPSALDAKAILKQVVETYKNLKSYHFEGRYTTEQRIEAFGVKDEMRREELFVAAAVKPDRSRLESNNTTFTSTSVVNGKTKWVYAPGPNEYTKRTLEEGAGQNVPARLTPGPEMFSRNANVVENYSRLADRIREARITGEETVTIGDQKIACLVIEVSYAGVTIGVARVWPKCRTSKNRTRISKTRDWSCSASTAKKPRSRGPL